jgi:hypothetical protein
MSYGARFMAVLVIGHRPGPRLHTNFDKARYLNLTHSQQLSYTKFWTSVNKHTQLVLHIYCYSSHRYSRGNIPSLTFNDVGRVAQSVQRLPTGWTVRGSNPGRGGGGDFPHLSRPALRPTQPPVQRVPGFSRGKMRPGRDADPSPPSKAEVKNRVELYLYSP